MSLNSTARRSLTRKGLAWYFSGQRPAGPRPRPSGAEGAPVRSLPRRDLRNGVGRWRLRCPRHPVSTPGRTRLNVLGVALGDVQNNGEETLVAINQGNRIVIVSPGGSRSGQAVTITAAAISLSKAKRPTRGRSKTPSTCPCGSSVRNATPTEEGAKSQVIAVKNHELMGMRWDRRDLPTPTSRPSPGTGSGWHRRGRPARCPGSSATFRWPTSTATAARSWCRPGDQIGGSHAHHPQIDPDRL